MNEKIKQFAQEAGFIDRGSNHTAYMSFDHEKFAELIAAECMSVVATLSPDYPLRYKNNLLIEINHRDQIEELFRGYCIEKIKQHFGVEE